MPCRSGAVGEAPGGGADGGRALLPTWGAGAAFTLKPTPEGETHGSLEPSCEEET